MASSNRLSRDQRGDGVGLPPAIVVALDNMTGLQTARILARHGVPVIGIANDRTHYCAKTRVCQQILEAHTGSEALIETLEALGPTLPQKAVLVPCSDMSVLTLSRYCDRLHEWYHMSLPEHDTIEMLMDKVRFCMYAQEHGLPVPKMFLLYNRQDAEAAADALNYPCILKPPMKTPGWEANSKEKVYKAMSREEFLAVYDRCSNWADVLMVQEWVEGKDSDLYSCNVYFNAQSEPLVTFVARKLRQWPPETGTSCLGEEVRNDVVLEETIRLFKSVNYRGLGYVEMKRDERTGQHYIIEPNIGRPTGRSAIAEAGGVELVYTMYCDAAGLPLPGPYVQQYTGVKWIYLRRDFQSALHYWRRGELTLRDWWRSVRGRKAYAIFSWSDPVPFLADLWRSAGLFVRGGGKRARSDADASSVTPQLGGSM